MLALLLAALSLFAAAPAEAQQTLPPTGIGTSFLPSNLVVTAGDRKLDLTWTSGFTGSVTGGGHWVQYKRQADSTWTTSTSSLATTATSHSITSLTNGTAYDVRIFAVGRDGANTLRRGNFVTGSGTPSAQQTRSTNANLSALTVGSSTSSGGTFTDFSIGTFGASTTTYTASVANDQTHVKVTATVDDTGKASVAVRKGQGSFTTLTSGSASSAIALDVGANTLTVRVTAEDTTTTKDYTVTVTRAAAQTQAAPTGLTVTPGDAQLTVSWTAPSGSFSAYDLHFTSAAVGTVANDAAASGVNPAVAWVNTVNSPTASHTSYTIDSDDATLTNGRLYRVRLRTSTPDSTWVFSSGTPMAPQVETPATDADLSALTASSATSSAGPFSSLNIGAFSPSTTNYTATVPNTRTHVKLRPTVRNPSATVTVKGTPVSSGSESAAIELSVGANAITVRVTNGANTRDYTVTITRQAEVQTTATVSLSASPNALNENNHMFVTATLSAPLPNAVGIPLTVTNNSAEDGDYAVEGSARFSFPPNSTISKISISAKPDDDIEDETFTVSLGTLPRSVTAGTPSSLRIKIYDDDKPNERNVRLWASPNPVPEGSPVTVRVLLYLDSQPTVLQEDVTIPVLMSRGTAEDGDHGKLSHITIPGGSSSATGEIWTKRDADTEDERFWVALGRLPSPWIKGDLWFAWVTISENAGRTSPGTGGGGGAGGTPPPAGDSPPDEEPQDPDQADDCGENDRENLVSLYVTADGDNWNDNTDWISEEPLGDWHGVDTDEDGEVRSLRLEDNNLSGDMPTEELLCLNENTELKELALWDNELSGEEPDELARAVERAVLRDVAEALELNTQWFDDYEDPFSFSDWHSGVMTDDDERVTELDFTAEDIEGEIPGSIFELERLRVINTGCEVTLEVEAPERVSVMMPDDCPEETAPEDMEEMEEEETAASGGGGCALGQGDFSVSGFGLFLVTLVVFAALGRKKCV